MMPMRGGGGKGGRGRGRGHEPSLCEECVSKEAIIEEQKSLIEDLQRQLEEQKEKLEKMENGKNENDSRDLHTLVSEMERMEKRIQVLECLHGVDNTPLKIYSFKGDESDVCKLLDDVNVYIKISDKEKIKDKIQSSQEIAVATMIAIFDKKFLKKATLEGKGDKVGLPKEGLDAILNFTAQCENDKGLTEHTPIEKLKAALAHRMWKFRNEKKEKVTTSDDKSRKRKSKKKKADRKVKSKKSKKHRKPSTSAEENSSSTSSRSSTSTSEDISDKE